MLATISTGINPRGVVHSSTPIDSSGLAYDPDNEKMYIANPNSDSISVINTSSIKVIAKISLYLLELNHKGCI